MSTVEEERKERDLNRRLVTWMVARARLELLEKYPLCEDDTVKTKDGLHYPPKENTERMIHRSRVDRMVREEMIRCRFPAPCKPN
jgi:hypothetical protein